MRYDYIVVGGGIVGLASARALLQSHPGSSLLLIEKEAELGSHQTGHNSGVIHAGVYYKPGSLKARLCHEGNLATKAFCAEEGIPFEVCGKLIVATNAREAEGLHALKARARENQIDVRPISKAVLRELEPNVSGLEALLVPSTGIVDYRKVCAALAGAIKRLGGTIVTGQGITHINENGNDVEVGTDLERWRSNKLIVCAGLQSDRLARLAGLKVDFQIIPFRGEYFVLPAGKSGIVKHLIYPVPDPTLPFLGVHVTRMADGSVTLGPNAVLGLAREGYPKGQINAGDVAEYMAYPGFWRLALRQWKSGANEILRSLSRARFLADCRRYVRDLELSDLRPYPAGIRAQAVGKDGKMADDFLFLSTSRMLHVCNAPSPAATSAIPIGQMIADRVIGRT